MALNCQGLLSPRGARRQLQNEVDPHNLVLVVCIPHLKRKEAAREMVSRKAVDLLDEKSLPLVSNSVPHSRNLAMRLRARR